jgi:hypothetical protein
VRRALPIVALLTALAATGVAQTAPGRAVPEALDAVMSALSGVSLSDRENGEILGTARDLVDRPDALDRQPAADAAGSVHRLAVFLVPGAVDKLRRSSEFRRSAPVDSGAGRPTIAYVHDEAPAIRVMTEGSEPRAIIEVARRP